MAFCDHRRANPTASICAKQVGQSFFYRGLPSGCLEKANTKPVRIASGAKFQSSMGIYGGMHLIAFNCENLKSCVDQFRKDGIKVMGEPGERQVLVHPKFTCGILLELREGNEHTGPKPTAAKGIVGFKCVVVRVNDVDKGVRTFSNLGLKCNRRFTNHASGMHHAVFTLKGGGLIEIVAPINSKDLKNPLAKTIINRGEGFNQISLEATSGTVDKLTAAGVKCVREDQSHYWISPKCTMGCLIQLNPVDMGLTSQAKL